MRLWSWLQAKRGRFPVPPNHILTYAEIKRFWNSLTESQQQQCKIYVYRIRKPVEGDARSNMWSPQPPGSSAFMPSRDMILAALGRPGEIDDPYTIRIEREYESQPGVTVKEEVCIANFTMTMDSVR